MKKRTSLATSLIQKFDKGLKERILGSNVSKEALNKFREQEKKDSVKALTDLLDIKSKSESEVYEILNTMVKNSQFFMYCGPLLLNINPGPNNIKDYLNLQSWIKETQNFDESEWKPHLYTFMYYVYKILIQEKKDQVVNMLGQIGSGKTFNMIHIIEYFCCMVGPDDKQMDTFDMIHKSIQLVHIMGSIFRQNNLESTSCGILLRLGFGSDNKIANFDIDAKILDCTLPFSENGRSYSILHSFLCAATAELKRNFYLPENEIHLNFFRKFSKNFPKKTKERFKLNDYEIWNRFHSLLKYFDFTKEEVIEILQIFSFLININELGMTKGEIGHVSGYIISKGQCSHKLASLLNMDEDNFIHQMGVFKEVQDIKNTFISLMKYSYYIVFEYIIFKIKKKLKLYFTEINSRNKSIIDLNNLDINYINFLDFPGEVEDQTLGGLLTNLANECINLYAGNSYSAVVEQMLREKINLRLFRPLHSYQVVKALMGQNGLFSFLSKTFTEENFNNLKEICDSKLSFKKCIKFKDSNLENQQFKFDLCYSHTTVRYNYQSLYLETKSIANLAKTHKIFSISDNKIIKSIYAKIVPNKTDFFNYSLNILQSLFKPIEGLSPFVIYCLHSNNSRKLFFGNNEEYLTEDESKWVIPKKLTEDMLKNSLCIPVLYWHWFGYHEWIDIDAFLAEFEDDYQKIDDKQKEKEKLNLEKLGSPEEIEEFNKNKNDYNFKDMKPYDKANIILNNILLGRDCVIGKNKILFKTGTLLNLRKKFDKLLGYYDKNKKKGKNGNQTSQSPKSQLKSLLEDYSTSNNNNPNMRTSLKGKQSLKNQCDLIYLQNKNNDSDIPDKTKVKNRNNVELVDAGENNFTKKYNIFNIMDKSKTRSGSVDSISSNDEIDDINLLNKENKMSEKELAAFRKKNNIVVPSKKNFDMVNSLFNYNKNTNFNIFDYSKLLPEIIRIQCAFRSYQARQKKLLLKYLMTRIIMIQKYIRGMHTRSKFERLKQCLKFITKIQSAFKKRYKYVNKKATTIQNAFRKNLAKNKYNRKKKRYEDSLNNPEEDYFDSSDEESIKKYKQKKKKRELDKKIEKERQKQEEIRKGKEKERQKRIADEAQRQKDKELKKQKLLEKQKKMAIKQKERINNNKNQANTFYSFFNDLDKNSSNTGSNNYLGIPNAKKDKKDDIYDIENEKDNDKIIAALLLDKNLMRDNEEMNRLLANENGVKKDIRYKLLQLDNPTSRQNKNKDSKKNNHNYYLNGNLRNKNGENKGKRIEDKLLEYGKALKQKKAQERVDKLKAEDEECTFKPKVKKKKVWMKPFANTDFLTRAAQFEERKGKDLNEIKNTIKDPNKEEYTFKPKISKNSKKIKRNINDLYNWNKERQKKLEKRQNEKKNKEEEEIKLNQQTSFINNKSKIILSKKSRTSSKIYNNDNSNNNNYGNVIVDVSNNINNMNENENEEMNTNYEVAFDLWPNYLERKFYDEKEEIPLPDKKSNEGGFNHLDFIGNKKEFNNNMGEKDEEESEGDNEENNFNEGYNNYNNINNDDDEE